MSPILDLVGAFVGRYFRNRACAVLAVMLVAAVAPQAAARDHCGDGLPFIERVAEWAGGSTHSRTSMEELFKDEPDIDRFGFDIDYVRLWNECDDLVVAIDLLALDDEVAWFDLYVQARSAEDVPAIADVWARGCPERLLGGEGDNELELKVTLNLEAIRARVRRELGPQTIPATPEDVRQAYEVLNQPAPGLVVGRSCGISGIDPPGTIAIRTLRDAGRFDLIQDLLRSPNPGGRVYAAITLESESERGLELSAETRAEIERVLDLDVPIRFCSGCTGAASGVPARDVLQIFSEGFSSSPGNSQRSKSSPVKSDRP